MPPDPAPMDFKAGDLTFSLKGGKLIGLFRENEELIREIGFALRDPNWGTIPLTIGPPGVRETEDGRELHFTANNYLAGRVVLSWEATLVIRPNHLELEISGTYTKDLSINRAGLYVLLPPTTTVGRTATVGHTDGCTSQVTFPARVSPHQPMRDVRTLSWQTARGQSVHLAFDGETFEMEDQRNWTDDSFKIYGTPLDRPFPVRVRPGDHVRQHIQLSTDQAFYPLPRVHTCARLGEHQASSLLAATRIDVFPDQPLRRRKFTSPVHVAFLLGVNPTAQLRAQLPHLTVFGVEFVSVASIEEKMLSGSELMELLPMLRRAFPGARVGFGSAFYFTELNRFPPDTFAGYDFVYFGNAALVHANDERSILQTAAGNAATVRSARAMFPGLDVWVSPLSYYPRFNPNRTDGAAATNYAHPPDARQHGPFTTSWVLRTLLALAEAGCAAVEVFEASGPRGLTTNKRAPDPTFSLLSWLRAKDIVAIRRRSAPDDLHQTTVEARAADRTVYTLSVQHSPPYLLEETTTDRPYY